MSEYDFPTQFECQNRILNVKIRFSDSVRISKNENRKTKNEKRKAKNEKRKTKSVKRKSNQLHLAELHLHFKGFACLRMRKPHAEYKISADAHDRCQIVFSLNVPKFIPKY